MADFAATPKPPYYAVIFTSQRTGPGPDPDYDRTARAMLDLAADQQGFLGVESARDTDGFGVTVSYWADREAIAAWKAQADHRAAQERGRRDWYSAYRVRVAKVEG